MSKKKNPSNEDILKAMFGESENLNKKWTDKEIKKIFSANPQSLSEDETLLMLATSIFVQNGVTPQVYQKFYEEGNGSLMAKYFPTDMLLNIVGQNYNQAEDDSEDPIDDWMDDFDNSLQSEPIPGAENKSLVLRIQLRGVTKPPLWREVTIPANIDFYKLHQIIQCLFGWYDCHLWQFEEKPYGHGYRIAMPNPDASTWDDGPSNLADETYVTEALKKVGDKLVYLYDFGDDWIHDITVKEVLNHKTEHPVCIKYKSGNPIEDIGGVWGLQEYRSENGVGDINLNALNAELAKIC